ncbi:hypothetical protein K0651_07765 [Ornithinimicrobium sp. Arc0846-15]|nr:hypothetical protein [Ornithinimicrobium laminariae]
MDKESVDLLVAAIDNELPQPLKEYPGGWPDEIEAALIDAVLTIRAKYGQPHNGVRGAVARYRDHVGVWSLDSLSRLADYDQEELAGLLGAQRTSGRSKSSAIIEAAQNLRTAGVETASDLTQNNAQYMKHYVRVHGLGKVTWEYFTMLVGKPGVKADRWIVRWVAATLGRKRVSSEEARELIVAAQEQMHQDSPETAPALTQLDHAIWDHVRTL